MLKREVAGIKRQLRSLGMGSGCGDAGRAAADTEAAKPPRIRPTGPMVRKLRLRLGLTQTQLAALAGVSTLKVGKWEKAGGRIGMRPAALAGLDRVRAMGKRQIKVELTETASSEK
jgi:DNA-binding transcriptional regulator YiaG